MALGHPLPGAQAEEVKVGEDLHAVVVPVAAVPDPVRLGRVRAEVHAADVVDGGGEAKEAAAAQDPF